MERSYRERPMAVGNARLKFGGRVRLEHMNLGKDSNGAGGASLRLMKMEEKKSKDKTLGLQQQVMETCRNKGQLAVGLRQIGR